MAKNKNVNNFTSDVNREIYNNIDRQTRVVLSFADVYKNGSLNDLRTYSKDNDVIFYDNNNKKINFSNTDFYTLVNDKFIKVSSSQNLSKLDTPLYLYNSFNGDYNQLNVTNLFDQSVNNVGQQRASVLSKKEKENKVAKYKTEEKQTRNVFKTTTESKPVKEFKKNYYSPVRKSAENLAGLVAVAFPFTILIGGIVLEIAVTMLAVATLAYWVGSLIPNFIKTLNNRRQKRLENTKVKQSIKTHSKDFEKISQKENTAKQQRSIMKEDTNQIVLEKAVGKFDQNKISSIVEKIIEKHDVKEQSHTYVSQQNEIKEDELSSNNNTTSNAPLEFAVAADALEEDEEEIKKQNQNQNSL